jgi:hypothetical protein
VVARRVRTDRRWDAGVGAVGAKVWRSLDVDRHANVEPAARWQHDINDEEYCRDGRAVATRRFSGGVFMRINRRRKARYGGFE